VGLRYPDSVEYLYSLGNEVKSLKFGLEGITILLEELGNPQRAFRSIHVAGTNGKGSTCAMIESGLRANGVRTGLYTSPHLVEPTERIQIAGSPVTPTQFAAAFRTVHECAEALVVEGRLEHHTTYFETVTAMGFLLFRELGVEVAAIEVGLGGRLDATNVLRPELSVITPIDFDHEQFLGNSLQSIAGEKAGILKTGVPAVFSAQRPEAEEVLDRRAAELGIEVVRAAEYSVDDLQLRRDGCDFTARWRDAIHVHCPLAGSHQVHNAVTAVAALERFGISTAAIEAGIASTRWPARLERVSEQPEIILDGAHNPAGARALADHIRRFYSDRQVILIYGAMRDKSVQEITEILFPLAAEVVLTAPSQPRAVRPEALRESSDHPRMRIAASVAEAVAIARAAQSSSAVFITGSLYLAGEARALLVQ
jgi:dihydrofolate synthase/folylpolyglutamate synthase